MCGKYHELRPDSDNFLKYLMDVMTGILVDDDCVVSAISMCKVYDRVPRTEFSLIPLPEKMCV
jgi:Holliday junction resolvase RusA-like endonuclease